jgi:hypothetical protein
MPGSPSPAAGKGTARHVRAIAVLLLASSLLSLSALAQVTQTGDYLAKMDADGDGRVSVAEYQAWMSYGFDGMDRDRDGVLAPAEQPGGKGGALTRAQHLSRLAERFARQDVDGNGFLDARELSAPPR